LQSLREVLVSGLITVNPSIGSNVPDRYVRRELSLKVKLGLPFQPNYAIHSLKTGMVRLELLK
jgi:hypothetical protein